MHFDLDSKSWQVPLGLLALVITGLNYRPKVMVRQGQPEISKAQTDEATIAAALHQFRLDTDRYPTTAEGLHALYEAPAGTESCAKEPYLKSRGVLIDPWGNPNLYFCSCTSRTPESFKLLSLGEDGELGGTGLAADIVDSE